MAAVTQEIAINKANWTKIADGQKFVAIQLSNQGRVKIHVADTASPPDAASFVGINIARNFTGVESAFSMGGLPEGTAVWVRSQTDDTETITVLTY